VSALEGRPRGRWTADGPSEPQRVFSRPRRAELPTEIPRPSAAPGARADPQKSAPGLFFLFTRPGLTGVRPRFHVKIIYNIRLADQLCSCTWNIPSLYTHTRAPSRDDPRHHNRAEAGLCPSGNVGMAQSARRASRSFRIIAGKMSYATSPMSRSRTSSPTAAGRRRPLRIGRLNLR